MLVQHEGTVAQVGQGRLDTCERIHPKWLIRDNRLQKGCPDHQHEAYWHVPGLYLDFVALTKCHQLYSGHFLFSDSSLSFEDIDQGGVAVGDRQTEFGINLQYLFQVYRIGGDLCRRIAEAA